MNILLTNDKDNMKPSSFVFCVNVRFLCVQYRKSKLGGTATIVQLHLHSRDENVHKFTAFIIIINFYFYFKYCLIFACIPFVSLWSDYSAWKIELATQTPIDFQLHIEIRWLLYSKRIDMTATMLWAWVLFSELCFLFWSLLKNCRFSCKS